MELTTISNASTAMSQNITLSNTECALFDGHTTKCFALVYVKRVSASFAIAGSLFTLFLILLFKKYREPSQRMIANLSLAAFFYGIGYLIEDIQYEVTWSCRIQGAFLQMMVWVCFLWIMCILFNLYLKLFFEFDVRKIEIVVTLICWILPLVLAFLPFIDDSYGPAGAWCWLKNKIGWRFGLWYIWRIVFVIVFLVVMIHMHYKLHSESGNRHSSAAAMSSFVDDMRTLRIYPIVYFILNIFPIINRVNQAVNGDEETTNYNFVLLLLQSIMDPMYGGVIAVVYVLDSRTRQSLNAQGVLTAFHSWRQEESKVKEYSTSSQQQNKDSNELETASP